MNSQDLCVIDIEGVIGVPEEWQFDTSDERVATYEKFRSTLSAIEQVSATELLVNIRSTGGDVNDALLIYEALTSLNANITTRCYGYVASAATVIAQAASEGHREISANALYLVHNSSCAAEGNAMELSSRLELLQKTDERLAELYARRSGQPAQVFIDLMSEDGGHGRWLTPQEAQEFGLADAIFDKLLKQQVDEEAQQADEDFEQAVETEPIEPEESAPTSSVRNLWREIKRRLGSSKPQPMPEASHSVLHDMPLVSMRKRSLIEFEQGQIAAKPTLTKSVEDPAMNSATITANAKAYQSDVAKMKQIY